MENDGRLRKRNLPDLSGMKCTVIVAHPDDETLWAGGVILSHPEARWHIITLCRASDADRAPKFARVLAEYNAAGAMGDLDDGPEQAPLQPAEVENTILSLLGERTFDLIVTHSPSGEYTRHRRHEETGRAVLSLAAGGRLKTNALWLFAYSDNDRQEFPKPIAAANVQLELAPEIWTRKYDIITTIYGFAVESWEAQTTPKTEAFWTFSSSEGVEQHIHERSKPR